MMAVIAFLSELISAPIQIIEAIFPGVGHTISEALSQAFDYIISILG